MQLLPLEGGASNNPCSDTFAGRVAFSEPETLAISKYYGSIAADSVLYLSFHSYGQYLLLPYGHTLDKPRNFDNLRTVSLAVVEAIKARDQRQYTWGIKADVMCM